MCLLFTQVREHPKYHVLQAKIQKNNGELEKAMKSLDTAMNFVKAQRVFSEEERKSPLEFGLSDKLSLYLDLATVYRGLGKHDDAKRMMDDALVEFKV